MQCGCGEQLEDHINQQVTRCQMWYKNREGRSMQKEASVAKRHWGKSQRSQKNWPLNNSIK